MVEENKIYPWGGDFREGNREASVAVVLLNNVDEFQPQMEQVALYGPLKTENLGLEMLIANVISNPKICFVVLCGNDIRGHKSGESLVALHKKSIDENNRIIDAPGATPYIENIEKKAISRFREQVDLVNLIGVTDPKEINAAVDRCVADHKTPKFAEPYFAISIVPDRAIKLDDRRALHPRIVIDYRGKVRRR